MADQPGRRRQSFRLWPWATTRQPVPTPQPVGRAPAPPPPPPPQKAPQTQLPTSPQRKPPSPSQSPPQTLPPASPQRKPPSPSQSPPQTLPPASPQRKPPSPSQSPPQTLQPASPQRKPPSPSQSPSASPSQIPIRTPRRPSPSPRSSSQAAQTSLQQKLPSSRRPSKPSPTPTPRRSPSPSQEAGKPQKEEATQEVSQPPSLSIPLVTQPDSPTKKTVEPQAQDSQPTAQDLPQTLAPSVSTIPVSQPDLPTKKTVEPQAQDSQPTAQDLSQTLAPPLSTAPVSQPESPTKKTVEPQAQDSQPTDQALSQTLAPSLSTPPVSQLDSPAKKTVEPQAQDSQPTAQALSQTTGQPLLEISTRPQAQEESLSKPASQSPEAGSQTTQSLEPKTATVDTVLSTILTQKVPTEREPTEIREEKSITGQEVTQEQPPVEEKPQISKQSQLPPIEEKRQIDEKSTIQTSKPSQVEGKIEPGLIEDKQPPHIPQGEEKHERIIGEESKTELEVKERTEPRSPELETVSEGNKKDESKIKPEAQQAEKSTFPGDELKAKMEIESATAEPDSKAPRLHPDTSELMIKPYSGGRPSSIPGASTSREEIKEGISIHKLILEQLQQQGSERTASIITLEGKNTGATMFIGHDTTNKEGIPHIRRGHRLNNKTAEANNGDKEIQKQMLNDTGSENPAITASINSNVQSINNSVLCESSCSEENPGVQLVLSIKTNKPVKLKEREGSIKIQRSTVSTAPA